MKKIMKLMLAFVLMVMYLIPNVSAVSNNNNGVITIKEAISGKKYSVYQILVLDSYDEESNGYVYKVPTGTWANFINSTDVKGVYLNVDSQNYVTWVKDADQAAFAKMALQYAIDNNIDPTQDITASGTTVTFENLNLGYYLVDSSLGALCGLTTTKPSAEVNEKNSVPTVTKEVMENTVGEFTEYADKENTAFIGETVSYQTTITVGKGAQNYKLFDTMDNGLTFNNDITVKLNGTTLTKGTDYVISESGDHKFAIEFKAELNQNDVILVEYTATLNSGAVVGGNGNKNTTYLEYGAIYGEENETRHTTTPDTTTTYTYSFELVKTNDTNKVLEGAKFRLYDGSGSDANEIYLVRESEGVYRVDYTATSGVEIEAGVAVIKGLDAGKYYLEETQNPDGYTKLLTRTEVEITNANLDATTSYSCTEGTLNGTKCDKDDNTQVDATQLYVSGGVQVINTVGNSLPETGGIGTTLFITIGSLMVTLFGVLLVTKFRMSKMDN